MGWLELGFEAAEICAIFEIHKRKPYVSDVANSCMAWKVLGGMAAENSSMIISKP